MARYWIGNSGSWTDTVHWSTTSGGAGGASVPTSSDDVIFDANSATANFIVNLTTTTVSAKSLNSTALIYRLSFELDISIGFSSMEIYGDFLTARTFTINNITVRFLTGSVSFSQAGIVYKGGSNPSSIYSISIAGASVTFQSNFNISNISLQSGSLDTNGYDGMGNFTKVGSGSCTLTLGDTKWYAGKWSGLGSNFTLNAGTSEIEHWYINGFDGGGLTYYDVWLSQTYTTNVTGNNTFHNLKVDANKSIIFASGSTQTVQNDFTIGNNALFTTSGGGSNSHNLVKNSGTVTALAVSLKGSHASGGATFYAAGASADNGYNTGWIFDPPAPVANFTASPLSGIRPTLVNFTDTSTSAPSSWLWDFKNDGTATSTLQNPTYTYTPPGTYTVKLTATNSSGSSIKTRTNYITITVQTFISSISGTLLFSGFAQRKHYARREAKGTLLFSGSAFAIRITDPSVIEKKTYLYKIYNEDNDFLGVWDDVISDPGWSEELNTAGSSHTVILARNSDSLAISSEILLDSSSSPIVDSSGFNILTSTETRSKVGPGSNVNHNYRVDIFVFYGEVSPILDSNGVPIIDSDGETIDGTTGAPNGRRIFTGFISEINTKYGDTENTEVQLMSYGFDLDQYPVVNLLGETTVAFNSYDPAEIVRDGIDQFTLDGINTFTTYTSSTVQDTGTTVSYTFRANTYKELLDKALQLAPSNYYYYIDLGSNLINFLPKPTTANHLFYLGKHIKTLDLRSYIGDTVNDVIFTGGGDPALYRRTTRTPIIGTRRGLSRLSDNRVILDTSADILAEGELDSKENIQYRSTIQILDKTYDLESINLGDMVGFRNFDNYVDGLLMQIVAKEYTPDVLTLQLDTLPQSVPKRLEELRKALNTQETTNVPDEPA